MSGTHYASWKHAPAGEAWRWPHFTAHELACKCGRWCDGSYFHQPDFLDHLEVLRHAAGAPLHVNSGHRCDLHNAHVGGAPLSQHKAIAADIALAGHDPRRLAVLAAATGFTGLGFGRTFLHVDRRPARAGFHYPGGKSPWTRLFGFDPAVRFKLTGSLEET